MGPTKVVCSKIEAKDRDKKVRWSVVGGRAPATFSFRTRVGFRGARTLSYLPVVTGNKRLKVRANRERERKAVFLSTGGKNLKI